MILGVRRIRNKSRRAILSRVSHGFPRDVEPIDIELEDAATYSTMKAMPEDVGMMFLYPTERCAVIEGLTHRYLIYADDVTELSPVTGPQSTAAGIQYNVEGVTLRLAIKRQGVGSALKMRLMPWTRNQLLRQISAALQDPTQRPA